MSLPEIKPLFTVMSLFEIGCKYGNGEWRQNPYVKTVLSPLFENGSLTWDKYEKWASEQSADKQFRVLFLSQSRELLLKTLID